MREKGYSLGGEQSGHVIFGDIETTGDGIMTSLRIMEVMRAERMTLSELCAPVKIFPQVLVNVRSERKAELDECEAVWAAVRAAEEGRGPAGASWSARPGHGAPRARDGRGRDPRGPRRPPSTPSWRS